MEIHDDDGLVPDDPAVVPGFQHRDVAGAAVEFGAVVHPATEYARDVVLKMGRLTALGLRDRLDRRGPAPARFEDRATDRHAVDLDELQSSVWKFPYLLRPRERLHFRILCCNLSHMPSCLK